MKISGQIIDNLPKAVDKSKFLKWLEKNDGSWFVAEYKIAGKHKCPKTKDQLGYYWAGLLPAIGVGVAAFSAQLCLTRQIVIDFPCSQEMV